MLLNGNSIMKIAKDAVDLFKQSDLYNSGLQAAKAINLAMQ